MNQNFSKYLNNWHTKDLSKDFASAQPFPHIVIDDFLAPDIASKIASEFPSMDNQIWFEYNNPIEKKLACDDIRKFPLSIASIIHFLNSESFLKKLEQITGIHNLQSDPYLHGGGIHCSKKGGQLAMHLDYSIHPKLNLERRLNIIIYMTPDWLPEWGGNLELWDKDMSGCVKNVDFKFNRAVLFATSDISYHGHPDPINSPEDISRNSIALYYLTEPTPNCSTRPRALFVARPHDDKSEELENFRKKRSLVSGIY